MTSVFFIFLITIVIGFLGSLLGLGGGIIMTPMLTLLLHVDIRYAIGASIIPVIAMSGGAAITYLKDHLTNARIGMLFEIGITLGAITDAFPSGVVDTRYLYLTLGLLMLYSAVMMFRKAGSDLLRDVVTHPTVERLRLNSSYYDRSPDQEVPYQVAGVHDGLGMMYVVGTTSGLLRIGSGVFKVVEMDLFMKLSMKVSSVTSNFMVGVTATVNAGAHSFCGGINPDTAAPAALDVLMGVVIGTRAMRRMESRVIRLVPVPVLVIVSVRMIVKGVLMG